MLMSQTWVTWPLNWGLEHLAEAGNTLPLDPWGSPSFVRRGCSPASVAVRWE